MTISKKSLSYLITLSLLSLLTLPNNFASASQPTSTTKPVTTLPNTGTKPITTLPNTGTKPITTLPNTGTKPITTLPNTGTKPITTLPNTGTKPVTTLPNTGTKPVNNQVSGGEANKKPLTFTDSNNGTQGSTTTLPSQSSGLPTTVKPTGLPTTLKPISTPTQSTPLKPSANTLGGSTQPNSPLTAAQPRTLPSTVTGPQVQPENNLPQSVTNPINNTPQLGSNSSVLPANQPTIINPSASTGSNPSSILPGVTLPPITSPTSPTPTLATTVAPPAPKKIIRKDPLLEKMNR